MMLNPDPSSALAERMLEEGRISPALASAALDRHHASGDRFEEALLECGLPESMLLRHLAEMFGTRFISTKTLASAAVPRQALQRLPRRLAERYQVVPIRFADDETLTVIAAEPGNAALLENVRVSAGAREVKGLVARPAAIQAAILKFYGGDASALAQLVASEERPASRPSNGAPLPEPSLAGSPSSMEDGMPDVQLDTSAFDAPAYDAHSFDGPAHVEQHAFEPAAPGATFDAGASDGAAGFNAVAFRANGFDHPEFDRAREAGPSFGAAGVDGALDMPRAPDLGGPSATGGGYPMSAASASWSSSGELPSELDEDATRARSAALGDASKLAEALMVIHERTRASLKSHSVRVARLSHLLCRQLDLSEEQAAHAWATGLFHDLGKTQQQHLTALNVWQLADHETIARAQFKNPARLLKRADVPETVITAITHMYERYDGKGFPDGLAEERIPFQSRVLALCDSIADLTLNPDNTLGRIVSPIEACNHIRAQTPKVFDPTLLAHFSRLLVERKLDGAFLSDQHGIEKLLG